MVGAAAVLGGVTKMTGVCGHYFDVPPRTAVNSLIKYVVFIRFVLVIFF